METKEAALEGNIRTVGCSVSNNAHLFNAKATKELTERDPNSRCYIYTVRENVNRKVVYVGQTVNVNKRGKQLARSDNKLSSFIAKFEKENAFLPDILLVDSLPNGCALRDADRFEARGQGSNRPCVARRRARTRPAAVAPRLISASLSS